MDDHRAGMTNRAALDSVTRATRANIGLGRVQPAKSLPFPRVETWNMRGIE